MFADGFIYFEITILHLNTVKAFVRVTGRMLFGEVLWHLIKENGNARFFE